MTDITQEADSLEGWANRAYLVGPFLSARGRPEADAGLEEMERLCRTAGLQVAGGEAVRVRNGNPAFLLGRGAVQRIITTAQECEAGMIVFDYSLSPVQMRNWAREARMEIHDRHAVILEIFSRRATTREAQLQVEMARARYAQSHLVGMWQHLSRQGGGSRLARGEGEKQLEMDRRRLAERVSRARRGLVRVSRQRDLRRSRRESLWRAALVGYTNAGKSSLLNALANARVTSANKLFATLDPVTRRLFVPPDHTLLLTDTVGFVRNLPPQLIQAFHSTLEEALEANMLLHVVDAADREAPQHIAVTREILKELGAHEIPRIVVLNKADLCPSLAAAELSIRGSAGPDDVIMTVSAVTGAGIPELRAALVEARAATLANPDHSALP